MDTNCVKNGQQVINNTETIGRKHQQIAVYFNIQRDADEGGDTLGEDARLIGMKIFYTIDDVHEA